MIRASVKKSYSNVLVCLLRRGSCADCAAPSLFFWKVARTRRAPRVSARLKALIQLRPPVFEDGGGGARFAYEAEVDLVHDELLAEEAPVFVDDAVWVDHAAVADVPLVGDARVGRIHAAHAHHVHLVLDGACLQQRAPVLGFERARHPRRGVDEDVASRYGGCARHLGEAQVVADRKADAPERRLDGGEERVSRAHAVALALALCVEQVGLAVEAATYAGAVGDARGVIGLARGVFVLLVRRGDDPQPIACRDGVDRLAERSVERLCRDAELLGRALERRHEAFGEHEQIASRLGGLARVALHEGDHVSVSGVCALGEPDGAHIAVGPCRRFRRRGVLHCVPFARGLVHPV